MDKESPIVVPEFQVAVHGRLRDKSISFADGLCNSIIDLIGGEPWVMVDDDWTRMAPKEPLTIVDDQGFMYQGRRRYIFGGPFVGGINTQMHDGYRTQHGGHND